SFTYIYLPSAIQPCLNHAIWLRCASSIAIDFSDLKEQLEVRLEEGLDSFVVVDGLPIVNEGNKAKLVKFLLKKLNTAGRTSEDAIYMPLNEEGKSEGFAFVEYRTPEQATAATKLLHLTPLDKKHTMLVNKLTDIERYGREDEAMTDSPWDDDDDDDDLR
ncbi:Translation initiation factor 3 subunit b, partial [Ascosphaera acerosa]